METADFIDNQCCINDSVKYIHSYMTLTYKSFFVLQ